MISLLFFVAGAVWLSLQFRDPRKRRWERRFQALGTFLYATVVLDARAVKTDLRMRKSRRVFRDVTPEDIMGDWDDPRISER